MDEIMKIENIPIDKIVPNIYQPRIKFDNSSITELSNSIKKYGMINPIIVRKINDKYELIDGERRYKATKQLGLKTIPAIVKELTDQEVTEIIIAGNSQKQLLSPLEEANAYQQMLLLKKFNIDQLAEEVGKSKEFILNKLKLLTLPYEIQEALLNKKISETHAKYLAKLENKSEQIKLFQRIITERMTIKELENIINTKTKENNDKISLKELNNPEFLNNQKNKKEEITMNNQDLNFNQYNNLLKEAPKPEMMANEMPTPIMSSTPTEPKANEFFPSLEEQPLNFEVPQAPEVPQQMPNFELPPVEQPIQNQVSQVEVPTEIPQVPSFELPQAEQPIQNQMPQVQAPTEMPQIPSFELPPVEQPIQNQMPQVQAPTQPPQIPSFELPPVEQPIQNQVPQVQAPTQPPQIPSFELPPVEQPIQNQVPQVEVPQQPQVPSFELPQVEQPIQNQVPQVEVPPQEAPQQMTKDVTPAVNMIKNLIPLLENSGYQIAIEENNTPNEYQINLKIVK